jgi:LysM repeat protein
VRRKLLKVVITAFFSIFMLTRLASAQTQTVIIYTVQAGETLQEIAQRFNVSVSCLADGNLLVEPVVLETGMQLTVSASCPLYDGPTIESEPAAGGDQGGSVIAGEEYTVAPGNRLAIIARDNDVSLECLVAANGIFNPDLIYVGQTIFIPEDCTIYEGQGGAEGTTTGNGVAIRTPTGFLQLRLQPDGSYIVEYGDMLDFIALYFNVSTDCLALANGLANAGGTLTPGQRIVIYPGCAPWDGPPGPGQVVPLTAQNVTGP